MGLAERLAEPGHVVQMATAYVEDLAASTSPQSLNMTKQLVHAHWSASFEAAARDGHGAMMRSLGEPDFAEGVASFLERRPPTFHRIGDAP
jgi:enoyl-CoA hydratase/carnithine racemase